MKTMNKLYCAITVVAGMLWSTAFAIASSGDFITQIPVIDGELQPAYHIELHADSGQMISPHAMEGGESDSALFQLWGEEKSGGTITYRKLDEGVVGVLMPKVNIRVETVETVTGLHNVIRTRVDTPFRVIVEVRNIPHVSDNASDNARKVLFSHSGQGFDLDNRRSYSPAPGMEDAWTLFGEYEFSNNLDHDYAPVPRMTMLHTVFEGDVDPSIIMGRERFTATTMPNAGKVMELAREYIEVWPMASGSVEGIEPNTTVYEIPHNVTASVKDAYPYCEVFFSVWNSESEEIFRYPDSVLLRENVPQDITLELGAWMRENIIEDGEYIVLVEADTPFNPFSLELLAEVPFSYRRTVEIRGNITTSPSAPDADVQP